MPETSATVPGVAAPIIFNVSNPTLEMFRPAHANGTAVIVAPGGGFVGLGYDDEGTAVARRLVEHGITAFVLKYRTILSPDTEMHMPAVHMKEMETVMARAKTGTPLEMPRFSGEPHAVEDGERAMAIVRQHAAKWGINPHRIGFIGFSAGAYLAADLAIGDKASRPDFVGLIYGGLRTPIPHDASPAFIAGASDDEYQPNDPILLYTAWRKAGAPAELHLFEHGGHGFGLGRKGTTSDHWFDEFIWWMQARGLLELSCHKNVKDRLLRFATKNSQSTKGPERVTKSMTTFHPRPRCSIYCNQSRRSVGGRTDHPGDARQARLLSSSQQALPKDPAK